MTSMGEGAYYHERMSEAKAWISGHPRRFIELSVERAFRFWVPASARWYQSAWFALATFGALGGIAAIWRRDRYHAVLMAIIPLSYSGIYSFVQADIRYSYPMLWLYVLLTAELVTRRWPERGVRGA